MSYRLVADVLDELTLPPTEKAVLLAMAEISHDDLEPFFVTERQLMHRTGYSERAVRQAVELLAARRLVIRVSAGNAVTHEAAVYRIDPRGFPHAGPSWEWDSSRAEIRASQVAAAGVSRRLLGELQAEPARAAKAAARRAADRARDGAGSGRTRRRLRQDAPQAPAGRAEPAAPAAAHPVFPVRPHAYPSLAPVQNSGAERRSEAREAAAR